MSSSVHWKGRSMGFPLFCKAGGGWGAAGAAGGGSCASRGREIKNRAPNIAQKGHLKLTTLLSVFFAPASNFTARNPRLLIKSPLRQRAHSPLSPKRARFPHSSNIPSKRVVLRYRSAASGSTV